MGAPVVMVTPTNFMHHISHYGMTVFPEAKHLHFIQTLRFMLLDTKQGYELCSSWAAPVEGLSPLVSQAFMNYSQNLQRGKVAIRDVYAIIAHHLPPDDRTYLESMSAAELKEMASRDVGWEPRPTEFDSMSLEQALITLNQAAGAAESMASNGSSGMSAPEIAM